MGITIAELEGKRAQEIADEWRLLGYEVAIGPTQEQLPPFLAGFSPDLLMKKGGKSIVVEVRSRTVIDSESPPSELAAALKERPGWSYWLAPVQVGEQLSVPKGVRDFAREDVLDCAVESERLLEAGFAEAAFVKACAAADGAVRMLLDAEGELVGRPLLVGRPVAEYAIGKATQEGAISSKFYFLLMDAMERRNAIIHGFGVDETDAESVREVVDAARRLLKELEVLAEEEGC